MAVACGTMTEDGDFIIPGLAFSALLKILIYAVFDPIAYTVLSKKKFEQDQIWIFEFQGFHQLG